MRVSQFPLFTVKETPADAEIVSHQLMLRAGLIRKLAGGLYTWMPLGLRVLRKVENIIREEMNKAGALEVLMPTVQPAELWMETGRWDKFGPQLLHFHDRHQREYCYGPTHEEVITDLVRNEIRSYKQLPINFYQIQTKFRDEIRPRFGVMRAREFIMKDAYSFHIDEDSLQKTYETMHQAYSSIFKRMQLDFRPVLADSGAIGGSTSHEFHVLANSGEDAIAFSSASDYAANIELATAVAPADGRGAAGETLQTVATPGQHSIDEVSAYLQIPASSCLKTLLVKAEDETVTALVLRGDHELNTVKAEKIAGIQIPLTLASEEQVLQIAGCKPGSIGPLGLNIRIIADHAATQAVDFVCGANQDGKHLRGVNWGRDLPEPESMDIRNVVEGDPSPDGQGKLSIVRGIEVGHIFQLGNNYSEAMKATVLDEQGKSRILTMGCYGIGVTRIVAAAIEQNHDNNGITWPLPIAPFQVAIVPINMHKSERIREAVESLYADLQAAGFEILLDDRNARPGVMFADLELIGIPHRVVVSERGLDEQQLEYKGRNDDENRHIPLVSLITFLKEKIPIT